MLMIICFVRFICICSYQYMYVVHELCLCWYVIVFSKHGNFVSSCIVVEEHLVSRYPSTCTICLRNKVDVLKKMTYTTEMDQLLYGHVFWRGGHQKYPIFIKTFVKALTKPWLTIVDATTSTSVFCGLHMSSYFFWIDIVSFC